MDFERFEGKANAYADRTKGFEGISVTKSGCINILKGCQPLFDGCEWVELFFDKKSGKIGIVPLKGKNPYAYKLNSEGVSSLTIGCKAFINQYNIGVLRYKFDLCIQNNDGLDMLVFSKHIEETDHLGEPTDPSYYSDKNEDTEKLSQAVQ